MGSSANLIRGTFDLLLLGVLEREALHVDSRMEAVLCAMVGAVALPLVLHAVHRAVPLLRRLADRALAG